MALTKIGSIGINTGIQFAGVTTIATLNASDNVLSVGGTVNFVSDVSIGGTVSIAGTLTYEDVTNIDAVGLITARNGVVVGSGITLSKDGDIFATGIVTASSFVGNVTGNISGGTVAGSTGTFTGDVDIASSLVHTGDTDTKLSFSTNTIKFDTNTEERLRITSTGAVGINSTNPENILLELYTDASAAWKFRIHTSVSDGAGFYQRANGDFEMVLRDASNNNNHITGSSGALQLTTSNSEKLRITSRGDIAFNRVGMSTAVGDTGDTTLNTADPNRFLFNNHHSNGYTDASLKLYLYNHNATRQGFTSGPEYDLQYHTSGSSPANTNLSTSKHTFFKENKKIFQLGYKSSTGENVIGHVGLTTGTSKLAWGNPVSNDYRLTSSGGGALVFGVDGDSEFFAVEGHWTTNRHVEYMRISKEGYMTKPYQPSFLVAAGRAGDGYTDSPYQFRTAVRNVDSAFKMGSGTGQYSYYYVPITGLYLFTTHAAYQQSGVSFNTRIHRYNSAGAVQEVLELHRNVGFSGSHAGGAGSCMMYCTAGDYVYVAPDFTPYHLNTTLNFFAGCLLG